MKAELFISEMEQEWTEIPTESKKRYRRLVDKFSDESRARIFDQLLKKCRRDPMIADIYSAAEDLLIKPEASQPTTRGCADCEGTTWIYVESVHPITGEPYEVVKPCFCTPRDIKLPPNPVEYTPRDQGSTHLEDFKKATEMAVKEGRALSERLKKQRQLKLHGA